MRPSYFHNHWWTRTLNPTFETQRVLDLQDPNDPSTFPAESAEHSVGATMYTAQSPHIHCPKYLCKARAVQRSCRGIKNVWKDRSDSFSQHFVQPRVLSSPVSHLDAPSTVSQGLGQQHLCSEEILSWSCVVPHRGVNLGSKEASIQEKKRQALQLKLVTSTYWCPVPASESSPSIGRAPKRTR